MKPTTLEWISKAEDDFHVAQMSYRARRHPSYDAAVFHAVEPSWILLQPFLIFLSPYAVAYRYPGVSATKLDARDALKNCREVRRVIRGAFGLRV